MASVSGDAASVSDAHFDECRHAMNVTVSHFTYPLRRRIEAYNQTLSQYYMPLTELLITLIPIPNYEAVIIIPDPMGRYSRYPGGA